MKTAATVTPQMRQLAGAMQERGYNFAQRTPGVLLPYQQRWVADTSQVKAGEKSRRIGLTWAEAAASVLTAAKATGGQDVWYVGYNKDMAIEFILDAAQWARHFGEVADEIDSYEEIFVDGDERKSVLAFCIRFASGNRITALSSRPSNLRGKQGVIIIDEAAFHPELQELLKAAFAFLIWGGSVHIISTHDGVDNPFAELVQDIRAGKKPYSLHRIDFKAALADGLYQRVCLKMGKPWSIEGQDAWEEEIRAIYRPHDAEELDCIPSQGGGSYFSRALVESNMDARLPVLRLTCPEGFVLRPKHEREAFVQEWLEDWIAPLLKAIHPTRTSYYGFDFGRTGDLSVLTPLIEDSRLHRTAPFVFELRNVPFEQQRQATFFVIDGLPNFRGCAHDARGNGQYLAEVVLQKVGAERAHSVMLTREWYRDNFPKYKAAHEDREITLPLDADLLDDHRAVVMDKGVPKVPDTGHAKDSKDGLQRHGDGAISGVLAWFASLNGASPFEYASDGAGERNTELEGFFG
jgi:phage FluMu gp28-like protein